MLLLPSKFLQLHSKNDYFYIVNKERNNVATSEFEIDGTNRADAQSA